MAETVIFEQTRLDDFTYDDMFGIYTTVGAALSAIEIGETYKVIWDDIEYTCLGQDTSALGAGYVVIGNLSSFGGNGNDEPFVIGYVDGGLLFGCLDFSDHEPSHSVGIFVSVDVPDVPDVPDTTLSNDVVIQNYSQTEVTYPSVPKVWLKSAESTEENTVLVPFSYGEAVENVPISLDFSSGENQTITAPDGTLVKSAVIEKPVDLVAENIRRGKVIANVEGDFIGDTEEIAVDGDNDLTFAGGESFVVEPSSADKVISKVTISPPSELKAENIAKGVTIAGIEGTHEGGGGGSAEFNIAFGDVEPEDRTKLWIQGETPSALFVSAAPFSSENNTINKLSTVLPSAASQICSAIVGTKVYIFGGYTNSSLNTILSFDIEDESIKTLSTTLPSADRNMAAAAVGTKIYLFGGNSFLSQIYMFDAEDETIETLSTTLPSAVRGLAAAAVGTKIYLFGGYIQSVGRSNAIWVFDTTNNTIETASTTLPSVAEAIAAVSVGTKIYLFGGAFGTMAYQMLNTINVFDTSNNSIETLSTTLPTNTTGISAALVGTKIYLFGGKYTEVLNTINVFDLETGALETLTATLPQAMYQFTIAAFGTSVYLFGGYGTTHLDSIYKFSAPLPLAAGSVRVVTTGENNLFRLLSNLETYIHRVYRGNSENNAELADAFLYVDGEWVNIIPPPSYKWYVEEVSGASYGFAFNGAYYVSQNKGVGNSYAICKVVIDTSVECKAVFNCINYAESNYDFGILSTLDNTLSLSYSVDSSNVHKSFKGSSMSSVQTVEYTIPEGTHFVYVKFRKDSSGNSYNDTLQFNVTLTEN